MVPLKSAENSPQNLCCRANSGIGYQFSPKRISVSLFHTFRKHRFEIDRGFQKSSFCLRTVSFGGGIIL